MSNESIGMIEKNIADIINFFNKGRPESLDLWDYDRVEGNKNYIWSNIIENNIKILEKFRTVQVFLSPEKIESFMLYTEQLKGFLTALNSSIETLDKDNPPEPVSPPSINVLTVGNDNYNSQQLIALLEHMQEKEINSDISFRLRILLLKPNITPELISELADILVKFHNSHFEQNGRLSNELFTEASLKLHQIEIREELEKAKAAAQEIIQLNNQAARDLGLPISENLISRYQSEYKLLDCPIKRLSIGIFGIFIVLLLGIASASIFIIQNENLPDLSKIYFLYLSFMLFSSGLLAYCVKERSRLVSIQDKLKISYLELVSLSDYMFEFDSVERVSLRKQLASTYFQGPNEQYRESSDLGLISEKVSDLTKIVNDLKSTIK